MKLVNWRYPEGRVFLRFDKGAGFEKTIRRAVGLIVGESFFGWMQAERGSERRTTVAPAARPSLGMGSTEL